MKVKYTLSYESQVESDLTAAIDFYNEKQKDLGLRFYKEYLQYIKIIKKNPFIFQERYDEVHIAPLKTFPFLIFYTLDKKDILILAILPSAKDSEKWP
jgi:hypothetical protein